LAERLQDIAWTMRERGFDSATCDEIESVASRIREASVTHGSEEHHEQELKEPEGDLFTQVSDAAEPPAREQSGELASSLAADEESQHWAQELTIPADAPTPVEAGVPSAPNRPPTNEPEAFVGLERVESIAVARMSEARFVTADIASLIRATAEPLPPDPVADIDDGDDAPSPAETPAAEPPVKEEMPTASIMETECSSPAAGGNPQVGALKVPPVLAISELTDPPALSLEESVFTGGGPRIKGELEHVPAMPALLSDIPHEDMLSGAWEESAAKREMRSSLPARSEIASPTEASILNDAKLHIPDEPLDAASSDHEETDSLLDLEQELFAPSPANPPPDMTPAQAPRGTVPTPAVAAQDALAIQAGPAGPNERTAVSGVPTSMRPAAVPSAPVRPAAKSMPRAAPYDPLAALKALTDEERIALFT
jgi:hypothetical protein